MFDVHQTIFDEYGEELDERRVQSYIDGLMEEFAEAPEAQPIIESTGSVGWAAGMMDYAANYLGETPATMSLTDFDEVLFMLFPRKVSTEADSAAEIVEELRAFWRFLDRQYGLEQAFEIAETLDDEAVIDLKRELSDSSKFGMAKSFVMSGKEAGFDMTDPQEANAFIAMYHMAKMGIAPPEDVDPEPPEDEFRPGKDPLGATKPKASRKQKRKKRKAQKQARKRNRR